MIKQFTLKTILLMSMLFLFGNSNAQEIRRSQLTKSAHLLAHSRAENKNNAISLNHLNLVGCNVDSTQNSVYPFKDTTGALFNGYLCDLTDSVSGTFANLYPFYDGDGYSIKLIAGSQVTFSIGNDSCGVHPASLTLCDSANVPIAGAYSASACPNSLNFTATYTGVYIIVMNENGICGGGGQVGIGDIFCYKQAGTTLPACLAGPANDSLCGAFPLILNGAFFNSDNSSATSSDNDDVTAANAGYICSTPNNTLWYSYTATATENVSVVYSSPLTGGLEGWLGVFSAPACSGPLTYLNCLGGPFGDTITNVIPVTAGTTYYFMIDGVVGAVGTFGIGLQTTQPFSPNDTICGAISLVLDGSLVAGNTNNASDTDPLDSTIAVTTFDGLCSAPNNTLWYEYTPAATDSFEVIMTAGGSGFSGWLAPFSTATGATPCLGTLTYESTDCLNGPNNLYAAGPTGGATGDTSINHLLLTAGNTYYFMVDGVSGAKGSFNIGIRSLVTGLNEFENNIRSLTVYPNPANDQLNVKYTFVNSDNVKFTLTDITGRVLIQQSQSAIKNGLTTLNVKNISSGVYMLQLESDKGKTSRKILIQH